ncbi:hypothetical protein M0R45_018182 [Rubus argutus]|uniref:Uncharacterized protein n=1 Tax=Rubus argutus TaxID=59490 RepID=A0AAW1X1M9_RUBAR
MKLSRCTSLLELPDLTGIPNLEKLDLSCCKRLREIPELPPNLVEVDVSYCESLEKFWKLSKMESILLNNQENSPFRVAFPGTSDDPMWFNCWKDVTSDLNEFCIEIFDHEEWEKMGLGICEFSIKISENWKWEKIGLAICVVQPTQQTGLLESD